MLHRIKMIENGYLNLTIIIIKQLNTSKMIFKLFQTIK